jgi:hypothetical protein
MSASGQCIVQALCHSFPYTRAQQKYTVCCLCWELWRDLVVSTVIPRTGSFACAEMVARHLLICASHCFAVLLDHAESGYRRLVSGLGCDT